jgi:hypothetical protein
MSIFTLGNLQIFLLQNINYQLLHLKIQEQKWSKDSKVLFNGYWENLDWNN